MFRNVRSSNQKVGPGLSQIQHLLHGQAGDSGCSATEGVTHPAGRQWDVSAFSHTGLWLLLLLSSTEASTIACDSAVFLL